MENNFQKHLREELNKYLLRQKILFPLNDTLKIDLHCHDLNSDKPDELIGKILDVPESWLKPDTLVENLRRNGCDTFTITNHNNARSCYELQDKGLDILTGAEFSCMVPDYKIGIHVLAYGFTPQQEMKLDKLRRNLYSFLEYAKAYDIPVIWAHPLYHYAGKTRPPLSFFHKMLLVFERFEVLNGQRDAWQNLLVKEWIENVTPEHIEQYTMKSGINPSDYCSQIYRKTVAGGSDCHMGVFSGRTGTYLYVENLKERLMKEKRSDLALEAIRNGNMAPFGAYQGTEKMILALLDYACQIAVNYKDPGLVRLMLHRGNTHDKLIALLGSNLFSEVQKHKITRSFLKIFHGSLMGENPPLTKKLILKPAYKPVFDEAVNISHIYKKMIRIYPCNIMIHCSG